MAGPLARNPRYMASGGRRHDWRIPATRRCPDAIGVGRSPRAWLVFEDGGGGVEHRVDDAPGFLDVVLTGEARGHPTQRVREQLVVGGDLGRVEVVADGEL